MTGLRIGSLCSGYGGLDLAVQAALPDSRPVWHSEIDPDAARVLEHHWPDVPNHGDLRTVDWARVVPVDVVTAGFPCQPVSAAGQRKGMADDRWIWDDITTAVGRMEPRPGMLLLENVPGLLTANRGDAMARVVHGLAGLGYVGRYRLLRASDVGAPHRRERWFCLATLPAATLPAATLPGTGRGAAAADTTGLRHRYGGAPAECGVPAAAVGGAAADAGGPAGAGWRGTGRGPGCLPDGGRSAESGGCGGVAADTAGNGWDEGQPAAAGFVGGHDAARGDHQPAADAGGAGLENRYVEHAGDERAAVERGRVQPAGDTAYGFVYDWRAYANAVQVWEYLTGRATPAPTVPGRHGQPRLNPVFVEWMMGLPDGWVTGVAGITRNAQLRLLGNGVVPWQGTAAFTSLLIEAGLVW